MEIAESPSDTLNIALAGAGAGEMPTWPAMDFGSIGLLKFTTGSPSAKRPCPLPAAGGWVGWIASASYVRTPPVKLATVGTFPFAGTTPGAIRSSYVVAVRSARCGLRSYAQFLSEGSNCSCEPEPGYGVGCFSSVASSGTVSPPPVSVAWAESEAGST